MSKSYATRRQYRPEDRPRFAQRPFAPARVVQAYSVLKPQEVGQDTSFTSEDIKRGRFSGAYRQSVTTAQEGAQSEDTSFKTSSQETLTGQAEVQLGGVPELKVSEHKKLAINNVAAQPKEFFAEPAEVAASNEALEKVASNVRLQTGSGSVKLPGNETALVKVEPGKPSASPLAVDGIEKLVSLASNECNNVITQVVGGAKRVVVMAEHGLPQVDRTEIPADPQGLPPNLEVRDYLSQHPDDAVAENARQHQASFNWRQADDRAVNAAYRNLPTEARQEQAQSLGLNEYAEPRVGEGYVIKSEFTPEFMQGTGARLDTEQYMAAIQALQQIEPGKDVTSQQAVVDENVRGMMNVWSVHYAGVVARDGADTVTLENYNRIPEKDWEVRRIFNNLFADFADFQQYIADKAETLNLNYDTRRASQIIKEVNDLHKSAEVQGEVIEEHFRQAVQEAQDSLATGLNADGELYNSLIHFQMYGPGDQSFHSTFKGMTSSPITYRTRASVKEDLAEKIKNRWPVYSRLLANANLGHVEATAVLSNIGLAMEAVISSASSAVRSASDDDGAQQVATDIANDRITILADPKLARFLYRCYCKIVDQAEGNPPQTRAALTGMIDAKLDKLFTFNKASLRALKTLIANLPDHLDW